MTVVTFEPPRIERDRILINTIATFALQGTNPGLQMQIKTLTDVYNCSYCQKKETEVLNDFTWLGKRDISYHESSLCMVVSSYATHCSVHCLYFLSKAGG